MRDMAGVSPKDHIDGLLAWWSLAGVDACVGESPTDWFARPTLVQNATAPVASPRPASPIAAPPAPMPATLDAFHDWLARATDQPEARWIGNPVAPVGPADARLMVLLDMPEDTGPGSHGDNGHLGPDADRLLNGILRAIGLDRDAIYLASLCIRRPPGGVLSDEQAALLATRMQHQIMLARPRALLMLGDGTSRAMTATSGLAAGENLHFVNHSGGKVPAIGTFHPRFMLSQPLAKAECWRALQNLTGIWDR